MPSSYTTSLRLTLPATGELGGQWGNTVNTGITELLDAAVAGTTVISTWGGAGVPYTLSNNSGLADEARKMFIVATGSPGEAKNVICPAVSKMYVFRNDTTGGYALTLKTSGGTGISVPAGQYKFLYCDGTNVVEAVNSLGPVAALSASQAVFTDGSKNLVSNAITGTGNVVMSTSPTLVTPALGTPTALVGTNITGTATAFNINGTVGATTPNTGAFTTLAASGAVTLSGGTANGVLYLDGSKVATSGSALTFDGSTVGVFNGTTVSYRFNANRGTDDTSQGLRFGFAGIDAYRTSATLSQSMTEISFTQTGSNGTRTSFQIDSDGNSIWSPGPGAGSEQMRLTSTGLEVKQSQLIGYSSYAGVGTNGLAVAGNVGIGTSSPGAKLDVQDASTGAIIRIGSATNGSARGIQWWNGGSANIYGSITSDYTSGVWTYDAGQAVYAGQHVFRVGTGGEAMRLNSSGLSVSGTITSVKGSDVASASTVTLGAGNFFDITGTTTISAITIKPAGTVIYLKFDSSLTLQTGTIGNSGAMRLTGGASLGVSQYDVLTLISDGTNWWQVAYNNN